MLEMAKAEMTTIDSKLQQLEQDIKILLLPRDDNDGRNILLEIRAGAGGIEASKFAGEWEVGKSRWIYFVSNSETFSLTLFCNLADLLEVYRKFIASQGWKATVVEESLAEGGGYKTVIVEVKGAMVFQNSSGKRVYIVCREYPPQNRKVVSILRQQP